MLGRLPPVAFFGGLLEYQRNHPDETVAYLKHNLSVFNDPIVTVVGPASSPGAHAILAYGYDANNIYFYDPNSPRSVIPVPYTAAGIGASPPLPGVGPVSVYAIINHPSFGGKDSFAQIAAEADGGFAASANLTVTSPQQNATVNSSNLHGP